MKYQLPDPPASGVVWTRFDGVPLRWTSTRDGWVPANSTGAICHSWSNLLAQYGEVFDVHPDFDDLPPFPWSADTNEIRDVNDCFIFAVRGDDTTIETDDATARFIVDTINAYVSGVDR